MDDRHAIAVNGLGGTELAELLARARRLARRLARVGTDADDLAQTAVLEVLRCRQGHRGEGTFFAWAHRVMTRIIRRRSAAGGPVLAEAATLVDARTGPATAAVRRELRERLAVLLDRLADAQRETLRLRVLEGCTIEEIAARTGVPLETARTRLRVAKQKLAAWIADDPILRAEVRT